MATQRQKKLAKAIVENQIEDKPKSAKDLLVSVGYAINTAEVKPKEIMEAEGVQSEVKTILGAIGKEGITPIKIAQKINELLDNPGYKAVSSGIDFALKVGVGGGYAPEKSINLNANLNAPITPKVKEVMTKFEDELFNTLGNE